MASAMPAFIPLPAKGTQICAASPDQVSRYAMATSLARTAQQGEIPCAIELPGPEGEAVRERIGREAFQTNVDQFCCGGLNFGYFYAESPIIAYDGCRTPHLWLRDGRSLYDALGSDFALLRFDSSDEVGGLVSAAADRGVPLAVLDVDADDAAQFYPRKLLLSRPDQHVEWRGDAPPINSTALIDLIRGATIGHRY
jgi:hypothetical protein